MAVLGGLLLVACSNGTGPGDQPPITCTEASTQVLAVGEYRVIDPAQAGACVRFPAAGPGGAEHLYVALSAAGGETRSGVSASYAIAGVSPTLATRGSASSRTLRASARPSAPAAFHGRLRAYERTVAGRHEPAASRQNRVAPSVRVPVPVGTNRTFEVLASATRVDTFVQVAATAKFSRGHVAIFLDDDVPAGGYDQADIDNVGALFDDHLYGIDTLAFGRESDIDGNGQVIVLLSDEVNKLGDCSDGATQSVAGFFFAADLIMTFAHSNEGEVFYGWVPGACGVSHGRAISFLPEVFVHEFQHMISYNQHVLVAGGASEATWLNEGLSTFAEELAARSVPSDRCVNNDCLTQFASSDLDNASTYLSSPESYYLVVPGDSVLALAEYGATWLFTRWLVDHFAAQQPLGGDLTRRLVQTNQVGFGNVESVTGESFSTLVSQWQMANFLDDLPGVVPGSDRLQYTSWDFRTAFGIPYPLVPDTTANGLDDFGQPYQRSGSLRGGSGVHVLIGQSPGGGVVDFRLTNATGGAAPAAVARPRIALFRIR
jgi:hypothetical protein